MATNIGAQKRVAKCVPTSCGGVVVYLILGCGLVGYEVLELLKEKKKEFVIVVDRDEEKIEALKDRGYDAVCGDIRDVNVLREVEAQYADTILVLTNDFETNKTAVSMVRRMNDDGVIITRVNNPMEEEEITKLGADIVVTTSNVVASSVVEELTKSEMDKRMKKFDKILKTSRGGRFAIILQNNPDPDAMASAYALTRILDLYEIRADTYYGGEIGHHENKALVNLLGLNLKNIETIQERTGWETFKTYDKIVMVDTSPAITNAPGPPGRIKPHIVIDHHPYEEEHLQAEYIDIREEIGATSTILTEYIQKLGVEMDEKLATILLMGIRVDTQNFSRDATPKDLEAAAYLLPYVDQDLLRKIESPPMSEETLNVLGVAIRNRIVRGSYLVSNVGFIRNRDTLPQAADYLLRLEGISTVLVFGIVDGTVHMSARSNDIRTHIGRIMEQAFGSIGSAGGHAQAAAAQIQLGLFGVVQDKETLIKMAGEAVTRRFFEVVGVSERE